MLVTVLFAAVTAEALRAAIVYTPFEGIPAGYRAIAGAPGAIVAESSRG